MGGSEQETEYSLTVHRREKTDETFTRTYRTATRSEDGETKIHSYQKRTIVFVRKDGVTRVGAVGSPPLDDEDLNTLIDKPNAKSPSKEEWGRAVSPTGTVALNASWDVDPIIAGMVPKIRSRS